MKILRTSEYSEKLKIRPVNVNNIKYTKYTCSPKTKKELVKIIADRISEYGYECDLNDIDVSNITDMSGLFNRYMNNYGKINIMFFNGKIDEWNVSNVTNMEDMFYKTDFNGDISKWDVSNVTSMNGMFQGTIFDNDISKWNVSNVTDMGNMFRAATKFNKDISNWDTSSVTNMSCMFKSAVVFDNDISNWDVSNVTDMSYMFFYAESFDQDLSKWNVTTDNHEKMFNNCPIEECPEKQPIFKN